MLSGSISPSARLLATVVVAAGTFALTWNGGGTYPYVVGLQAVLVLGILIRALRNARILNRGGLAVLLFVVWIGSLSILNSPSAGIIYSFLAILAVFLFGRDFVFGNPVVRNGLTLMALGAIAINAASMFRPGTGWDGHPTYFLGGKNALAFALLPYLFILHHVWERTRSWQSFVTWMATFVAVLCTIAGGSGTGTVVMILCLVYLLTVRRVRVAGWIWFSSMAALHLAVLSGSFLQSSPVGAEILEALSKDATFTGRATIWAISLEHVDANPVGFGRGYEFIAGSLANVSETHNMFLEALVTGGWIGLVLLVVIIWRCLQLSAITRGRTAPGPFFVWAACILGAMESITFHTGFWLLIGLTLGAREMGPIEDRVYTHSAEEMRASP